MMKNLSLLAYLFLGLAIIVTAPSCSDDETGGGFALGPSVVISDAPSTDVAPNSDFSFTLTVATGDAQLNTASFYEDGVLIDLSRIQVDGDPAGANPKLILGTDKDGFTWTVTITAHADASTRTYSVEVFDDGNETDESSVSISTTSTPPSIVLGGSSTIITSPGNLVGVALMLTAGSNDMNTIAVYENSVLMDPNDLRYGDPAPGNEFTANPYDIPVADQTSFDGSIYIRANMTAGTYVYTIEVTDAVGVQATQDVTINVGTPVDMEFTAILVSNADGPNTGGLDLDGGTSVPAASSDAEVRDLGIDLAQPLESNWKQQIEAVNGASLRVPNTSLPETFTYESANSKEAIIAAYDTGIDVGQPSVNVDDIFLVKRGEDYFVMKVTNVVVTTTDNEDYYEFNVKQALK